MAESYLAWLRAAVADHEARIGRIVTATEASGTLVYVPER